MKRRTFMSTSLQAAAAVSAGKALSISKIPADGQRALIVLREYEMHFGTAENVLHDYFQHALIPALNRKGAKNVGVFKEIGKSEPAKIYLLFACPTWEDLAAMTTHLQEDEQYLRASADFMKLPADKFPYTRYKTKLMMAFSGMPQLIPPSAGPRLFELRTYESYNEEAHGRKIRMFNQEEFVIFYRTKLTPVFFGDVVAGDEMPCLTYMVVFKDMAERDQNWSAFGNDPDWKRVSGAPEYAGTVSRITKIFLEPQAYSQI